MHEASIALAIVEEVTERAAGDGVARIHSVRLRIGALTAVDTAALDFAWDLATDGTVAMKSTLEIEPVPLVIYCRACGIERTIEGTLLPLCTLCGNASDDIRHGRELQITAMEVTYAAQTG